MKTFKYSARSEDGTAFEGAIQANSEGRAIEQLKESGVVVRSIEREGGDHDIDIHIGRAKTKEKALALLCHQFAIILQAGMPIVLTVRLVAGQTENKALAAILNDVADDVASGQGLADSFERRGSALPTTFIETVRAGELAGSLDTVFTRLSDYYTKTSRSKARVGSAMIYPAFVIGIAIIVIIIIMTFAVPTFTSTFASMDIALPWITQAMISTSNFFSHYSLILLAVIAAIIVIMKVWLRNEGPRLKWSKAGLHVPVIGRIVYMNAANQYASTMSTMLASGLPMVDAVRATAWSIGNRYLSHELESILPDLEAGKQLSEGLRKSGAFPDLVVEMTAVGEESGSLEDTLDTVGLYYANEVDTATTRALSIMEPLLIVILAVIVCSILLAVYLPIFSLYGSY